MSSPTIIASRQTPPNSAVEGLWTDLQGSATQGVQTSALSQGALRDTGFQQLAFRHDQDDTLSFSFQMPHEWDYTKSVRPHLHLQPQVDPPGPGSLDAYFSGVYTWARYGEVTPALVTWIPFTATLEIAVGDAWKHMLLSLFTATVTAANRESDFLLIRVAREGTNLLDTFSTNRVGGTVQANLALLGADVHYQKAKNGTTSYTPSP